MSFLMPFAYVHVLTPLPLPSPFFPPSKIKFTFGTAVGSYFNLF